VGAFSTGGSAEREETSAEVALGAAHKSITAVVRKLASLQGFNHFTMPF
jgi:hypothetical protein